MKQFLLPAVLMFVTAAPIQVMAISLSQANVAYTENFNTLAVSGTSSSLPAGWASAEAGTGGNALYSAGTGSGTGGDTYSYGTSGNSERALGTLQTGSVIPMVGVSFQNDTLGAITSLEISYWGEQWRLGALGRVDRLDFQYSFDATSLTSGTWTDFDGLDFTSLISSGSTGALLGNADANRTFLSGTLSGLDWANGGTLWLRWTDLNASGSDDGLAIDDFAITAVREEVATTVPDSTPGVAAFFALIGLLALAPKYASHR